MSHNDYSGKFGRLRVVHCKVTVSEMTVTPTVTTNPTEAKRNRDGTETDRNGS